MRLFEADVAHLLGFRRASARQGSNQPDRRISSQQRLFHGFSVMDSVLVWNYGSNLDRLDTPKARQARLEVSRSTFDLVPALHRVNSNARRHERFR